MHTKAAILNCRVAFTPSTPLASPSLQIQFGRQTSFRPTGESVNDGYQTKLNYTAPLGVTTMCNFLNPNLWQETAALALC